MTLSLNLDTLCQKVTDLAATITGIRHAYNYDEWPDSPPGMFSKENAMHLTGFLEEGDAARYTDRGSDLSEWEVTLPLYTVVIAAAQVKRSRGWMAPYPDRYLAKFAANMLLSGALTSGAAIYGGCRIVRAIPDWSGYDGFYMLRHELLVHSKGVVTKAV